MKFDLVKTISSSTELCSRERFNAMLDDKQISLVCKKIFLKMVEYKAAKTKERRNIIQLISIEV